jgi:predicted trehalose synthase
VITDRAGESWVAITSQTFVQNPTDVGAALRQILQAGTADGRLILSAERVADALAAMHRALASAGSDPTFGARPLTPDEIAGWCAAAHEDLAAVAAAANGIGALRDQVAHVIDTLPRSIDAASSRAHGRLTLPRVLLVDAVPVFVGFGEALARRSSPLKDVASLARSFDAVTRESIEASAYDRTSDRSATSATMLELTARVRETFLARYAASAADLGTTPRDPAHRDALIRFFRVQAALRDARDALPGHPADLAAAVAALGAEFG